LDLRKPAARKILEELIRKVDVVAENFAPGLIGRMGSSYDEVRGLNPAIIMVSVSMICSAWDREVAACHLQKFAPWVATMPSKRWTERPELRSHAE
jgi:crotonobetainyl-CoA:carnitine CoA-transferase CaiB-like acyl-CoA transferase